MRNIFITLLLAVGILGFSSSSEASLIGDTITLSHCYPDTSTVLYGWTTTTTVVAGTSDQWVIPIYTVNPEDMDIQVLFGHGGTFDTVPFNGLVIAGIDSDLSNVNINTNIPGWDTSRLAFDSHNIYINFSGLTKGDNAYLDIDLGFQVIPEPASVLLFGLGLMGLLGLKKKK